MRLAVKVVIDRVAVDGTARVTTRMRRRYTGRLAEHVGAARRADAAVPHAGRQALDQHRLERCAVLPVIKHSRPWQSQHEARGVDPCPSYSVLRVQRFAAGVATRIPV